MARRNGNCHTKLESTFGQNLPTLGSSKAVRKAAAQRSRKQAIADVNRANSVAAAIDTAKDDAIEDDGWKVVEKPEVIPKKKKGAGKGNGKCGLKGHDHKYVDCPNNPQSENYCGVPWRVVRYEELAKKANELARTADKISYNDEEGGVDGNVAVNNELEPIGNSESDDGRMVSEVSSIHKSNGHESELHQITADENENNLVHEHTSIGNVNEVIANGTGVTNTKEDHDVELQTPPKKSKKKKRKNRGKRSLLCRLKGHNHNFSDCPNNPKSENYCGIHYKIIRDQEITKRADIVDDVNSVNKSKDEHEMSSAVDPALIGTASKQKKSRSKKKQQPKCPLKAHTHNIIDCHNNPYSANYCGVHFKEVIAQEIKDAARKDQEEAEATRAKLAQVTNVYISPEDMSNRLRQHLNNLTIKTHLLPLDMSNFYEKYVISLNDDLDVRRSTYHCLSNWLNAMESDGLVLIQKTWQSDKKYRKHATSKEVVAVGEKQVLQYKSRRSNREKASVHRTEPQEVPVTNSYVNHECSEDSLKPEEHDTPVVIERSASDRAEMSKRLEAQCVDINVDQADLPMKAGNFYSKYIKSEHLDVHKSTFRNNTKFMQAMEKAGHVLLKNQGRSRRSAPMVVIAVGRDQILMAKGNCNRVLDSNHSANKSVNDDEASTSSSETDSRDFDHIQIQPTRHAKQRQHSRSITDTDIKRTIENSKRPIKRGKDGVKEISVGGVTAIVACGQKNKLITTWKESDGEYLKRWSQNKSMQLNSQYKVRGYHQVVTISETFERHQKSGQHIGRRGRKQRQYLEGELVIKNNKKRKDFVVVGLTDDSIEKVTKQIKNQIGCRIMVGILDTETWLYIHGAEMPPLAGDKSKTILFNLAADDEVISRVLSYIEKVVPRECRRYLRETKECGMLIIREIIVASSNAKEKKGADNQRTPSKGNKIKTDAIKQTCLLPAPATPSCHGCGSSSRAVKKVNVDDLLGDDGVTGGMIDDEEENWGYKIARSDVQEDISSYF